MTRDSARAMVTTIGLYLVYRAHLSSLWWMEGCAMKQQSSGKLWWSVANFSHTQTQPKPASNRLDGMGWMGTMENSTGMTVENQTASQESDILEVLDPRL